MKKRFTVPLLFCILVSACNFAVEEVTPVSMELTPIVTSTANSPVSTTATPRPMGDLGYGEIHGKVTDALSGAPIAGAVITCQHYSFTSPATCSGATTTDADGMYKIEHVYFHDTDTIKLTVQAHGYQTHEITSAFFRIADLEANVVLSLAP